MPLRESYEQHKTSFVLGVTCLILILGGLYYYRGRSKEVKYITASARTGEIAAAVQATGTIKSSRYPPVWARPFKS